MDSERAGTWNPAEDLGVEDCFEACFEDAVDIAPPKEDELESGNHQLVVKSTFLDVMDGFSARQRFRSLRRAQSDPVLEAEAPAAYEPGLFEDSPSRAGQTSETTHSMGETSKAEVAEVAQGIEVFSRSEDERSDDDDRTTVMLRNLPNNYSREMFLEMLDQNGFETRYDFVYLPFDFGRNANLGYAFVNLVHPADVAAFRRVFQGYSKWSLPTSKVCQVSWSGPHQGFDAHVARYRNSPVMHRSVPDEYKPIIFKAGVRQEFPPATRRLKPPARFVGR